MAVGRSILLHHFGMAFVFVCCTSWLYREANSEDRSREVELLQSRIVKLKVHGSLTYVCPPSLFRIVVYIYLYSIVKTVYRRGNQ